MSKVATDFEKIINAGRERKRNEELADKIFKRKDTKVNATKAGTGPSLASRVGVKKRKSSAARFSSGDVNGEWTHDLHNTRSTPNLRAQTQSQSRAQQAKQNSLASRIHSPGTKLPPRGPSAGVGNSRANNNRAAKFANAFARSANAPAAAAQLNVIQPPTAPKGMIIRGLAGPYVVMAQNFAPGTTAADIESAMTPIGGLIESCQIIKAHPLVIAEIIFESRGGAEKVIEMFNNQTADGRILSVYLKPGGAYKAPTEPRAQRDNRPSNSGVVIDGRMGFDDPMETSEGNSGLYSDNLVANNRATAENRRGRGFNNNSRRNSR